MPQNEIVRPCYGCGDDYEDSQMVGIDVSRDDEYYPRFIYVCLGCHREGEPVA